MATTASQTEHEPRDITFRNYSSQQASNYAEGRLGYSEALIEFILKHHNSTGGHNGVVLDVGCGPGLATRMLAPHFNIAYGADPGKSMIEKAQEIGGTSKAGTPIEYKLSSAEELDKIDGLDHSSVDLVTAATAAHWFEMPKFWKSAAKILKPGGTVAIWTVFRPQDVSGNNKVQALIEDFRENVLRPYSVAGSQLTHDGYVNLVMPWDDPATASLYDRESSSRHELGSKDGYLPKTYMLDTKPGDMSSDETLEKFRKMINSLGSVNRWQQANPDLMGTKDDIVETFLRKLRQTVEDDGGSLDVSNLAEVFDIAVIIVKRV